MILVAMDKKQSCEFTVLLKRYYGTSYGDFLCGFTYEDGGLCWTSEMEGQATSRISSVWAFTQDNWGSR